MGASSSVVSAAPLPRPIASHATPSSSSEQIKMMPSTFWRGTAGCFAFFQSTFCPALFVILNPPSSSGSSSSSRERPLVVMKSRSSSRFGLGSAGLGAGFGAGVGAGAGAGAATAAEASTWNPQFGHSKLPAGMGVSQSVHLSWAALITDNFPNAEYIARVRVLSWPS